MKIPALSILLLAPFLHAVAQPCTPEALLKIPGQWKKGMQGSIENVSADNLAKEKAVLAEIHKMASGGYQPYGANAHHSTVFGYNKYTGKTWFADPYEYNVRLLDFLCDHRDNDIGKMWVNPETSTSVYFQVNRIFGADNFSLLPATYPDDRQEPFSVIDAWPEKKDGFWHWRLRDSGYDRSALKIELYLITYANELPFQPFTKKEYLEYQIPRMKKFLEESIKLASEIDPNSYDAKSYREIKQAAEERLKELREKIRNTEQLLVTMSARELSEGAVVKNDGAGDFTGFGQAGDPFVWILVKPNPGYFRPLPKWVPQYFSIVVKEDTDQEVFRRGIAALRRNMDFDWFRKMLGSTTIIPYQRPGSSAAPSSPTVADKGRTAPAPAPAAAPGITMTAGTGKKTAPAYNIYQNKPTKGFKVTPTAQLQQAVVKPVVNPRAKQAAMSVQLNGTSKSAYTKRIFTDIDARMPEDRKKAAKLILDSAAGDMQALANTGVFLFLGGYQQEGLWCLAHAAAAKSDDDNILNNLTGILVNMSAAPRALPLARYLASKYPRNTTVMNNLGQALYALDELVKAKQVLDTVMLYAVYHPEANATRAAIAEREGKQEEAAGFINKSLRGAYNPDVVDYARKKGMKIDYPNVLDKRRPFPGEYINAMDFRPPPQCTNVNFAAQLEAEWEAWAAQVSKATQKINAHLNAASANYERTTESIAKGKKGPGFAYGPFYAKAAETYKTFLQEHSALQEEAVSYAGNQYQREEHSIDSAKGAALEKLMKKYPGGEGSGINQEAYCMERNAIYNTYLEKMAALNDDFNNRFSEPLRRLSIELMYWSQFLPEPMELREMKYYGHALFAVAPLEMRSKFEYSCEKPEKLNKDKEPFDIPEPYCPFSFKFKVTVVKLTGDCSKFEMEFSVPGGILVGYERDFINRKTTLALGVGVDVEVEGFGGKKDPVGFIEDAIPQLINGSGAGVGAKMQGFIEFGPEGEMSDIGIRAEGSVEGAWTEKGDVKIGGKLGVNSGVQITGSQAVQPIVDYLNENISNQTP